MTGIGVIAVALWLGVMTLAAPFYNVRDYGAKGDGETRDTEAIQAAIDAAEKDGGGEVLVPAGRYRCGTLHLKNYITLHLTAGATLAQSKRNEDFDPTESVTYNTHADHETSFFHYGMVTGDGVHDIAIIGEGTLDGNRVVRGGPKPIALKNCAHIAIRGITVRNAPNYSVSFLGCEDVNVEGVTIRNALADGIDPDCSRFVRISNCSIESHDDSICLKTSLALGSPHPTEHVAITNCLLSSHNNPFKLGTESSGDFRDIALSNCAMYKLANNSDSAGIAIESVDGAHIDGLVISNVTMHEVYTPIFIRLGNRGRGLTPPVPGSLSNVSLSNIVATGATMACSITGLSDAPVRRVSLDNIQLTMKGGQTTARGLDIPEKPADYPECDMFGVLPAYGLYCRHVEELTLRNLRVAWDKPDARPALICDDVRGLDISDFKTYTANGDQPILRLHETVGATIKGCCVGVPAQRFLLVSGKASKQILLFGNDLSRVAHPIEIAPDAPKSAVVKNGNVMR